MTWREVCSGPVGGNTTDPTDMMYMFRRAVAFAQDITGWPWNMQGLTLFHVSECLLTMYRCTQTYAHMSDPPNVLKLSWKVD